MKTILFVCFVMALTACAYAAESPDCAYISRNDPKDIDNHYFPHETSCNAYYQCAHHGLVKMHCPKDLHFNREINQCGWPRDSECEEKAN